jgi:hypothetical protein
MDMWRGRSETEEDTPAPRRRRVLRAGICGLIAVAARPPTTARAQIKASQEEALYQGGPKSSLSCAVCTLFRPPHACVIVAGDISAQGWCRFFDMAD